LLGGAVHLRGVDVGHTELEAPAQSGDGGGAAAALDVPGPLADHRDLAVAGAEPTSLHRNQPSGDDAVQPSRDLRLGLGTHDAIDLPAALEHQQGGDAADVEPCGRHRILVHIELGHAYAPRA